MSQYTAELEWKLGKFFQKNLVKCMDAVRHHLNYCIHAVIFKMLFIFIKKKQLGLDSSGVSSSTPSKFVI